AESLGDALTAEGSVARLSAGELAAIDRAERDSARVVLRGGLAPGEEWTRMCVHETDLLVAVTTGEPDRAWLEQATALRGCGLVVLGPAVSSEVISQLQPREVQVIADSRRQRAALEATARRLA